MNMDRAIARVAYGTPSICHGSLQFWVYNRQKYGVKKKELNYESVATPWSKIQYLSKNIVFCISIEQLQSAMEAMFKLSATDISTV